MRLHSQGAMALTAGIVAALALVVGACAPSRLDVSTVAPCAGEWGPGPGGAVPCVWDAQTRGSGGGSVRWLYYSASTCPVATVQPADTVKCLARADWSTE
jgi:hypothetical protein